MSELNREAWLMEVARSVEELYDNRPIPQYRITCGWPSERAVSCKGRRVAECHSPASSKGGLHEIFISPIMDDSLEVAGTVVHELTHVVAGVDKGHGKEFIDLCKAVGLTEGKPTYASPGGDLNIILLHIIDKIGVYPHTAIIPYVPRPSRGAGEVRVHTRCSNCGCRVSISKRHLAESGMPRCGCGMTMELLTRK